MIYEDIFFINLILCSYCRDTNITAVDIDSSMLTVATDYFGLVQDNRLKVVIDDGVKFLKKAAKNGSFKRIQLIIIHHQIYYQSTKIRF